jgi:protein O-mannosyl-transferase
VPQSISPLDARQAVDQATGRFGFRGHGALVVCFLLVLLVGMVFGQTVGHKFLKYDDDVFVWKNPHVSPGLTRSGVWWVLTDARVVEWYPLASLSHMLDCELYGLKPAGHHLTNLLLHAASSVLLFLVLSRMTRDPWPSAWVAAIFAIHPLHVESVAWLAERRDVLSGLFFMLTLGAYALYAERPSLARYLAVAAMLALGLASKATLITTPFVLLLLDYWPLNRFEGHSAWRVAAEKIPLLGLSVAAILITLAAHSSAHASLDIEHLSFASRIANALAAYGAYFGQSFWPVGISPFYAHQGTRLPISIVLGSAALLVAVSAAAACLYRRLPFAAVGWFWFLGMLVPGLGLLGTFMHARGDRYTYLAQIGLSIAVAWTIWSVVRWRGPLLAGLSCAVLLALGVLSWQQVHVWRDDVSVWQRAVACDDQSALSHRCLAVAYRDGNRASEAETEIRKSLAAYTIAPYVISEAHDFLANLLMGQGKTAEAMEHYQAAVRVSPASEVAHGSLAAALEGTGQNSRAIIEWREAVLIAPSSKQARIRLADALLRDRRTVEATDECGKVLAMDRNSVEAMVILGCALAADHQAQDAISVLKRALELAPENARAREAFARINRNGR